jgi:hypothetical protein
MTGQSILDDTETESVDSCFSYNGQRGRDASTVPTGATGRETPDFCYREESTQPRRATDPKNQENHQVLSASISGGPAIIRHASTHTGQSFPTKIDSTLPERASDNNSTLKCPLGCRTKRGFRDQESFEAHVRGVHAVAIWKCLIPGCPNPGPYPNRHDLKRHTNVKHRSRKPYKCTRPNCRARAKEFSRKDKLKDHDRKHHSEFKCWFCSQNPRFERWFETEAELYQHTINDHRPIGGAEDQGSRDEVVLSLKKTGI